MSNKHDPHFNHFLHMDSRVTPALVVHIPKIQLDPKINVSNKFRKDYNAWLLEFFGTTPKSYSKEIISSGNIISKDIQERYKAKVDELLKEL